MAVQADIILPFIFFPALLKSNHFQSPYMRGTLRDGLEPHGGSLLAWLLGTWRDLRLSQMGTAPFE